MRIRSKDQHAFIEGKIKQQIVHIYPLLTRSGGSITILRSLVCETTQREQKSKSILLVEAV